MRGMTEPEIYPARRNERSGIRRAEITKDEIKSGFRKMNKVKAVGTNDASVEMLHVHAVCDEDVEILLAYMIFNHIYDAGEQPDNFLN